MSLSDLINRIKNNNNVLDSIGKHYSSKTDATFLEAFNNLFTGNLDYQRQVEREERQYQYNALEAQKQRDFEERLANTAVERQASQLSNLGVNSTAYFLGGGSGAATPSGASASGSSNSVSSSGRGFVDITRTLVSIASMATNAYISDKSLKARYNFNDAYNRGWSRGFVIGKNR